MLLGSVQYSYSGGAAALRYGFRLQVENFGALRYEKGSQALHGRALLQRHDASKADTDNFEGEGRRVSGSDAGESEGKGSRVSGPSLALLGHRACLTLAPWLGRLLIPISEQ